MLNHLLPKNRALYEIIWKNIVKPERQKLRIRHSRFSYWITKATEVHSEYCSRSFKIIIKLAGFCCGRFVAIHCELIWQRVSTDC